MIEFEHGMFTGRFGFAQTRTGKSLTVHVVAAMLLALAANGLIFAAGREGSTIDPILKGNP